jgi:hypothetical protein
MPPRLGVFISLLVGATIGCVGAPQPPPQPAAGPKAEAQKAGHVPPAAPVQAKIKGDTEAKVKELADLAAAEWVNANFKPMPQPALASQEEYDLACAVFAS